MQHFRYKLVIGKWNPDAGLFPALAFDRVEVHVPHYVWGPMLRPRTGTIKQDTFSPDNTCSSSIRSILSPPHISERWSS